MKLLSWCAPPPVGPGECDKREGGIAAELARLTSAHIARVCAQSRSPKAHMVYNMKQVNVLNPQLPLATARVGEWMRGRGKGRMCGGSSSIVSGRMRMVSKAVACLRLGRSRGMMSGKWGTCVSLWGTVWLASWRMFAEIMAHVCTLLQARSKRVPPGHDRITLMSIDPARLAHP